MIYTVENTWKELHEERVETAIVSFGAIEQHGHHLPLGMERDR
jgi:creatinine amidohydrolase/Fe(II)-dependent formamide hydrolase-like protein